MRLPQYVSLILERLESSGEAAYVVGGGLRDRLLGKEPHDYDIATSALPQKTREVFEKAPIGAHVHDTGIKHGTVTVVIGGYPVEVTTFRVDISYSDSRHPDAVAFTDRIEEDLSRRDFTVNAMAYSPTRGFVDVFGGREDLDAGIIRAVRDPDERFREDALRILRAFRFSAQLGFSIHQDTLDAAIRQRAGMSALSAERICSELLRLLASHDPSAPLLQMLHNGILPFILGSYTPSERLISLLPQMQASSAARLGFLLWEADEDIARDILNSLKCSNRDKTEALAVRRGASFTLSRPKDAPRLTALTGVYAPYALRASILLGNSPADGEILLAQSQAPTSVSQLAVSGRDMMALGAKGKDIGVTLNALLQAVMDDPSLNTKEALLSLAEKILKA